MSDPAPDPIDKAYAEAEAAMSDETARAARRARVLAAVGSEPAAASAPSPGAARRPAWRGGGWLVAASVAGLTAFVVLQNYQPAPHLPQTKPAAPAAPIPAPQGIAAPPAPVVKAPPPPSMPKVVSVPPMEIPPVAATPPPASKVGPPPPPSDEASERAAAAPAANQPEAAAGGVDDRTTVGDIVVTAQKREEHVEKVPVAVSAFTGRHRDAAASKSSTAAAADGYGAAGAADSGARLRSAAAAGKVKEVEALLAQGVAVDAPDTDGDTALIKSIEADQPAAAALLVRRGASLDHRNGAGQSARDLAAAKGDPALNRALGLAP